MGAFDEAGDDLEMFRSALQSYARGILTHVPWEHWAVMGVASLALTVILLIRKKCSVYGAIALGLTVFMGLFLLDTAVGIRYLGIMKHAAGHNLTLDFSRMFQKSGHGLVETFLNIAVFVPFGFFLAEFLAEVSAVFSAGPKSTTKRLGAWRWIGRVSMASFAISLSIECLQLLLHAGFFEMKDLVLNTLGGFLGALISVGLRKMVGERKHSLQPRID